nr:hypothetical protein [uncultured Fretibacterium sp.]
MSMETFEAMRRKERIYRELEISERQISERQIFERQIFEGKVRSAEEALSDVRARYGL